MKKRFVLSGVALLLLITSAAFAGGNERALQYAAYDIHAPGNDYVYRTGQVVVPQEEKKKTLWEYFSFFAWPREEKSMQVVTAEEAQELKMRVRELTLQLVANAKESIADEYVITVSSFVNLNNLYQTSSLGRYIGEQLLGELQLAGVEVIDVRKTPGLMIHERQGEYGLSREMEELSTIHSAHANLVGTYTRADHQILVNARLLRNPDGVVLSQANIVFALDPMTERLLADESMPPRTGAVVTIQDLDE